MSELRTAFILWYFNDFVPNDPLYIAMSNVSENSPHHREVNVAVHTNMVVAEYLFRSGMGCLDYAWDEFDLYGAFVCAFHDVGKPSARTAAHSPERGTYYRYGGHELISARLWEDWAVRNWKILSNEFDMTPAAIYRISWLIEKHLPWGIKKPEKRKSLAIGVLDCTRSVRVFNNIVKADTWGRISDDQTEKRANVNTWCDEFTELCLSTNPQGETNKEQRSPIMYMPIAVSGSGKSTLFNSEAMIDICKMFDETGDVVLYSLDELRLTWYDKDDYQNAFKLSCEDKKFKENSYTAFELLVDSKRNIYLDNMNISRKSRVRYIQYAKQHGYIVVAIMLPVTLQTVLDRQGPRTDKTVPLDAVNDMYMRLSTPSLGEVDRIITYSGNLPT